VIETGTGMLIGVTRGNAHYNIVPMQPKSGCMPQLWMQLLLSEQHNA